MAYLYGFCTTSARATQLDNLGAGPGAFQVGRVGLPDNQVLWGHAMIDDDNQDGGQWIPIDTADGPHVHASVTRYLLQLGPKETPIMFKRREH